MKVAASPGRIAGSLQAGDIARHAPKFGAFGAIAREEIRRENQNRNS
jgi:hypothetical protein